jgi:uncharacterized membrane protein
VVHAHDVVKLDMTVEDALKIVVSGGVVKFDIKTAENAVFVDGHF